MKFFFTFKTFTLLLLVFLSIKQLSSEELKEFNDGVCNDTLPDPASFNLQWLVAALKSEWFATLGSQMYFKHVSTLLNSSFTDLNQLCLEFTPATPMASLVGYGNFIQKCTSPKIGAQECLILDPADNLTKSVRGVTVWTDNYSSILLYICLPSNEKVWVLLGVQKNMSEESMRLVMEQVKKLGFDENKVQTVSYEQCANKNSTKIGPVMEIYESISIINTTITEKSI